MRTWPRVGGPSRHRDSTRSFPAVPAPSDVLHVCAYCEGMIRAIDRAAHSAFEPGENKGRKCQRDSLTFPLGTSLFVPQVEMSQRVMSHTKWFFCAKRYFSSISPRNVNKKNKYTHVHIYMLIKMLINMIIKNSNHSNFYKHPNLEQRLN